MNQQSKIAPVTRRAAGRKSGDLRIWPFTAAAAVNESLTLHLQNPGSVLIVGGLCQAMARMARKAEPTYDALIEQIRGSPSVTSDETGWRVGGRLWWMWAFSSSQVTENLHPCRRNGWRCSDAPSF